MKAKHAILVLSVFVIFGTKFVCAEGLDALIEVGKSQGEIAKAYSEETKAYESIKRAIGSGEVVKGAAKKAILEKYGEPVVMVGDYETNREKWIYKPATSDYGKGPRISLFFTKDGMLDEILAEK